MCTVTLIARKQGYCLGMNRDEKLTRPKGRPPRKQRIEGHQVIGPSEPGGGKWISVNDEGITFALINWYAITRRVSGAWLSRGEVVNSVSASVSSELAAKILGRMPLARINPFRLIGVFPANREVIEWRWDLKKLTTRKHRWKTQQWISSGYDEPGAQRVRSKTFRMALRQSTAGSQSWLRRLHCSHSPGCGPYSTCMHRADAATVSYTEVAVLNHRGVMHYVASAPCKHSAELCLSFQLGRGGRG